MLLQAVGRRSLQATWPSVQAKWGLHHLANDSANKSQWRPEYRVDALYVGLDGRLANVSHLTYIVLHCPRGVAVVAVPDLMLKYIILDFYSFTILHSLSTT